jgi:hypothetical protein
MKINVSPEKLREAMNKDTEFRFHSRYWDGALQFQFGEVVRAIKLKAGEVVSVDSAPLSGSKPTEVIITGPVDGWAKFLVKHPRPFYEDFNAAAMHHGFKLLGDKDYLWAYYAAIRRTGQILRSVAVVEEA